MNKNLSLTDHTVANVVIAMSDDTWKRLTPEQRDLIAKAIRDTAPINDAAAAKSEQDILAEFKASGVNVVIPDKAAFREKVKDVPATFQNGVLLDIYKKIQAVN